MHFHFRFRSGPVLVIGLVLELLSAQAHHVICAHDALILWRRSSLHSSSCQSKRKVNAMLVSLHEGEKANLVGKQAAIALAP